MSKLQILGLALVLVTPASSLYAQEFVDPSDLNHTAEPVPGTGTNMDPNTAASSLNACEGKTGGDACSFTNYQTNPPAVTSGICKVVEDTTPAQVYCNPESAAPQSPNNGLGALLGED